MCIGFVLILNFVVILGQELFGKLVLNYGQLKVEVYEVVEDVNVKFVIIVGVFKMGYDVV